MPDCCNHQGCAKVFDLDEARKSADRYRRKGLDSTARRMVDLLKSRGVEGRSVVEVGGGVGGFQLELLAAGAAASTNVELSPSYEEAARKLLAERGLEGRVERRVMDFAREDGQVAPADIVVMHRVVCCYPDMEGLVAAAARRARHLLALSFPRQSWWMRSAIQAENLWLRLTGTDFRFYVHPPDGILATAGANGLRSVHQERGWVWQLAVLERVS